MNVQSFFCAFQNDLHWFHVIGSTISVFPRHLFVQSMSFQAHTCTEYGKRFNQAGHLKDHMMTHTGKKPYECMVCKKTRFGE